MNLSVSDGLVKCKAWYKYIVPRKTQDSAKDDYNSKYHSTTTLSPQKSAVMRSTFIYQGVFLQHVSL